MNDSRFLDMLFKNLDPNSFIEPRPIGNLSAEKAKKLKKKKDEDEKAQIMLTKLAEAPYWID